MIGAKSSVKNQSKLVQSGHAKYQQTHLKFPPINRYFTEVKRTHCNCRAIYDDGSQLMGKIITLFQNQINSSNFSEVNSINRIPLGNKITS